MSKARIVVETSSLKKDALYQILNRHQRTLKEWFDEQLELFVEPSELVERLQVKEISSPVELADSAQVLAYLAVVDWAFTDYDTGYLTHDLHPYAAKFIPQIPAHLIARLSLPGEVVLDPFHGSATTAVEALRLGRRAICIDANPLSEVIGRAKTAVFTDNVDTELDDLQMTVASLASNIEREEQSIALAERYSEQVPDIPNISHWYSPVAIGELALLRQLIEHLDNTVAADIAWLTFSRVVFKVSYQDAETRYARREKEISPGATLKLFINELRAVCHKLKRASSILRYGDARFYTLDSRKIPKDILPENSVDFLVTSPPYPNSNDYHLYHRFRLFWLGHDPRLFGRQEIGSHLKHQRESTGFDNYMSDLHACMEQFVRALRPGRYAAFVVGDGVYKGEIYKTNEALTSVARAVGLEVCGDIERPIHDTRRSFVKPARRARSEHILILRKPSRKLRLRIEPPNYRMWDYEAHLRIRELEARLGQSLEFIAPDGPITAEIEAHMVPDLRLLTFSHLVWGPDCAPIRTWQAVLENGDAADESRKEPKYATHGIHAYKGKFYPQLAKAMINFSAIPVGSTVFDPFCGSGTTVLEAFLNGMTGVGCDMHPLAVKIASAKVGILTVESAKCEQAIVQVLDRLKSSRRGQLQDTGQFQADVLDEIFGWFPEPVVYKLNWLLSIIRAVDITAVREFLEVILSSIIRDVSQQDPRDLRIRRRKPPLEDAPAIELFNNCLSEQLERLRDFWRASRYWPVYAQSPRIGIGDSRQADTFHKLGLEPGSVDLVVTSPPYATALPYIDTDRLSLLVLFGMPSSERRVLEKRLTGSREITAREKASLEEILFGSPEMTRLPNSVLQLIRTIHQLNEGTDAGFRRLNKPALLLRYFSDMREVLMNVAKVLSPTAEAFVVIGDNQTTAGGQTVNIRTTELLRDIGERCGFICVEEIPITVTTENLRHIQHAITENTVLRFKLVKTP
jgi:DNA modification methylase